MLYQSGEVGLGRLSPTGQVNWASDGGMVMGLVLSDRGTIFGLAGLNGGIESIAGGSSPVQLQALESSTGSQLWSANLPPSFASLLGGHSLMALTPQGSLLIADYSADGGVLAYVAGQEIPSTTAPWSRVGADNTNRSCAR